MTEMGYELGKIRCKMSVMSYKNRWRVNWFASDIAYTISKMRREMNKFRYKMSWMSEKDTKWTICGAKWVEKDFFLWNMLTEKFIHSFASFEREIYLNIFKKSLIL